MLLFPGQTTNQQNLATHLLERVSFSVDFAHWSAQTSQKTTRTIFLWLAAAKRLIVFSYDTLLDSDKPTLKASDEHVPKKRDTLRART